MYPSFGTRQAIVFFGNEPVRVYSAGLPETIEAHTRAEMILQNAALMQLGADPVEMDTYPPVTEDTVIWALSVLGRHAYEGVMLDACKEVVSLAGARTRAAVEHGTDVLPTPGFPEAMEILTALTDGDYAECVFRSR